MRFLTILFLIICFYATSQNSYTVVRLDNNIPLDYLIALDESGKVLAISNESGEIQLNSTERVKFEYERQLLPIAKASNDTLFFDVVDQEIEIDLVTVKAISSQELYDRKIEASHQKVMDTGSRNVGGKFYSFTQIVDQNLGDTIYFVDQCDMVVQMTQKKKDFEHVFYVDKLERITLSKNSDSKLADTSFLAKFNMIGVKVEDVAKRNLSSIKPYQQKFSKYDSTSHNPETGVFNLYSTTDKQRVKVSSTFYGDTLLNASSSIYRSDTMRILKVGMSVEVQSHKVKFSKDRTYGLDLYSNFYQWYVDFTDEGSLEKFTLKKQLVFIADDKVEVNDSFKETKNISKEFDSIELQYLDQLNLPFVF